MNTILALLYSDIFKVNDSSFEILQTSETLQSHHGHERVSSFSDISKLAFKGRTPLLEIPDRTD